MKKGITTLLIVALALIVVGAVIVCVAFGPGGFKFSDLNTEQYEIMTAEITEEITEIYVNTDSERVRIIRSNSGTTTVTYPESDRLHYNVSVNESDNGSGYMLDVSKHIEAKEKPFVGIGFCEPEIIVAVPSDCTDMISVVTSSGDIAVEDGIRAEMVYCTSSSGNVNIDCAELRETRINTESGSIKANSVTASDAKLNSTSGSIKLNDISCDGSMEVKATSGVLWLVNVVCKNGLSAKSSSGDIILSRCDAAVLTLESSSGDIKGTVLSPKVFAARSSSGSIKVPETPEKLPEDRCVVTTSSGNIHLEVYETGSAE